MLQTGFALSHIQFHNRFHIRSKSSFLNVLPKMIEGNYDHLAMHQPTRHHNFVTKISCFMTSSVVAFATWEIYVGLLSTSQIETSTPTPPPLPPIPGQLTKLMCQRHGNLTWALIVIYWSGGFDIIYMEGWGNLNKLPQFNVVSPIKVTIWHIKITFENLKGQNCALLVSGLKRREVSWCHAHQVMSYKRY